jgi:hypothetical protein
MHNKRVYWEFLSRIWKFLGTKDIELWEAFWDGMNGVVFNITNKANWFLVANNIEAADLDTYEYGFDLPIGPLNSLPIVLDPTQPQSNTTIKPVAVKLVVPEVEDGEVYRRDLIQISASDYHAIRDVAIGSYAIINGTPFKVLNTLSSEEARDLGEIKYYKGTDNDGVIGIEYTGSGSFDMDFIFSKITAGSEEVVENSDHFRLKLTESGVTVQYTIDLFNAAGIDDYKMFAMSAPSLPVKLEASGSSTRAVLYFFQKSSVSEGRYIESESMVWVKYESTIEYEDGVEGTGRYEPSVTGFTYYIEVDGSLIDYEKTSFNFYLTSARSYKIASNILKIDTLTTTVGGEDVYTDGLHYSLSNGIIEFTDEVEGLDRLYCNKAETINDSMFSLYGGNINMRDWNRYNYNNKTAKSAISGLMKSLQEDDYSKALNLYYGMPNAISDSTVVGLYEAYGYEVLEVDGSVVRFDISGNISAMVSEDGIMMDQDGNEYSIGTVSVNSRVELVGSNLTVGDKLYVKLPNKLQLKEVGVGAKTYFVTDSVPYSMLNYLVSKIGEPEFNVYNNNEYSGVYHMVSSESGTNAGNTNINIYSDTTECKYNDYVSGSATGIDSGHIHIQWPTIKFLLLDNGNGFDTIYLDSGIDTLLDTGDKINKYDVITRNVSALRSSDFPAWNEYGSFKFNHGIDHVSSILEVTGSIKGAEYGEYL